MGAHVGDWLISTKKIDILHCKEVVAFGETLRTEKTPKPNRVWGNLKHNCRYFLK